MPSELGRAMVDGYAAQFPDTPGFAAGASTSVIDLYAVDPITSSVRDLASRLATEDPNTVARARARAVSFNDGADPSVYFDEFDLGTFAERLAELDPSLAPRTNAVLAAVDHAVVYEQVGKHKAGAHGVSVFLPSPLRWKAWEGQAYGDLAKDVAAVGPWNAFLTGYVAALAPASAPSFVDANHTPRSTFDANGWLEVSGTLSPASAPSVVDVTLYFGVPTPGGGPTQYIGDSHGSVDAATRTATAWFFPQRLAVTQGAASVEAYRSVTFYDDGSETDAIPVFVRQATGAPAVQGTLSVSWDAHGNETSRTWSLPQAQAQGPAAGVATRRTLGPTASFTVGEMVLENGAWVVRSHGASIDPNAPYDLVWADVAKGSAVAVELDAADARGAYDADTGEITR